MSETPRTDRLINDCNGWRYLPIEHARDLERELNAAKARIARLEEAVESLLPYAEATDDESSEWSPGRWKSEKLKRIIDEARKAKEAKP